MKLQALSEKQRVTWQLATARQNIWEGSVRSGKTICSEFAWSEFVRQGPPGNLLMCGKTERTLKRNVIDTLLELWGEKRCRHVQGAGELYLFGRKVYLAGANDERAQEKIRGISLVGAYVDEATTVPESFYAMLLSRLSDPGATLFATTNPDSPAHWLKRDYLDRASTWVDRDGQVVSRDDSESLDLARFSFKLRDNVALDPAYVEAIEREYAGLWYRRFILGEWVAAEGAVFDMLDIEPGGAHVVGDGGLPAEMLRPVLSIDYGTTNPTHALLGGLGPDNRLYILREWRWDSRARHRQLTDTEQVEAILEWLRTGADGYHVDDEGRGLPVPLLPRDIVVDPSAASFRLALNRRLGGWPTPADNAVLDGIRDVASLLATKKLAIHDSCGDLLRELAGYTWDTRAQDHGDDVPMKMNDHGPDALRYLVRHERKHWRRWLTDREPLAA